MQHLPVDFIEAFDFLHREKTGKILLAYGFPVVPITAITML